MLVRVYCLGRREGGIKRRHHLLRMGRREERESGLMEEEEEKEGDVETTTTTTLARHTRMQVMKEEVKVKGIVFSVGGRKYRLLVCLFFSLMRVCFFFLLFFCWHQNFSSLWKREKIGSNKNQYWRQEEREGGKQVEQELFSAFLERRRRNFSLMWFHCRDQITDNPESKEERKGGEKKLTCQFPLFTSLSNKKRRRVGRIFFCSLQSSFFLQLWFLPLLSSDILLSWRIDKRDCQSSLLIATKTDFFSQKNVSKPEVNR